MTDTHRDTARTTPTSAPPRLSDTASLTVTAEAPDRYVPVPDAPELGRGGIGRITVLRDTHLGREVAVKELLHRPTTPADSQHTTDPRASLVAARFLREARLTGQLEHPNIVPVYELGRRPDGTLYYTMKVVRGRDLASVLNAVKADGLRARLALLTHYASLADAIAYAHSRGVIHRDIKPENVMVGAFGETVVLDWGLAKPKNQRDTVLQHPAYGTVTQPRVDLGPTTSSDAAAADSSFAATADGALLGTPLYMSPEQAQGDLDHIDERSDVWALGVMLYELLTGAPPFWGKNAVELLTSIVRGAYQPVLKRTPDAPPELAAIAARALAHAPADRYPDAGALADDLRAYLTGGRVQAYSYSAWTLTKRWARRHRAALTVALAALAALAIVGVLSFRSVMRERDRAMDAHAQALVSQAESEAARATAERAERAATQARDSAEHLIRTMVSDLRDRLAPLGQLGALDDIAGAIQAHYEAEEAHADVLPVEAAHDYEHQRNRADVFAMMGDLKWVRGDLSAAARDYAAARALRDRLLATWPEDPRLLLDMSDSLRHEGLIMRAHGDLNGAQTAFTTSADIRESIANSTPTDIHIQQALIESDIDLGELAQDTLTPTAADAHFTRAVARARTVVALADRLHPADLRIRAHARHTLAQALDALAGLEAARAQAPDARTHLEEAQTLRDRMLQDFPSNAEWRHERARGDAALAALAQQEGRSADALALWERAVDAMTRLTRASPDNAQWARDLALTMTQLGTAQLLENKTIQARDNFNRALDTLATLAARDPSSVETQRDLETALTRAGDAAARLGHLGVADRVFARAILIAEALVARVPDHLGQRLDLARLLERQAHLLAHGGDTIGARDLAERAILLLSALEDPTSRTALTRLEALASALEHGATDLPPAPWLAE